MAGLADYLAQFELEFATGQQPMPAIGNRFLALFTVAPTSDAGTGGTEVTGGSYARIQIAGAVAATASFTTASPNITMTTNPGWVVPGMSVFDLTKTPAPGAFVGTVLTYVGTALVLTANSAITSQGTTDSLQFSAFPAATASSGTEPSVTPAQVLNGAVITFAQATLSWGTVIAWAIYDAVTSGNMIWWDYLGNFKWVPFSCSLASPGVLTTDLAADVPANGSSAVVTAKFGGTLPTGMTASGGVLTTAGSSTNTFNVGVNTTSTGAGQFRQITQQPIAANVTASFAASSFTLSAA
jgi:hypothetical protein